MKKCEGLEDFSLLGGPLHRLGCRLGLVRGGTNTVALGLALGAFPWIVLLALALFQGLGHALFSIGEIGAHVRLLVAIPLLFVCEAFIDPRFTAFVQLIVRSQVVPTTVRPALESEIGRITRWKDAWLPEAFFFLAAVLLALTLRNGNFFEYLSGPAGGPNPRVLGEATWNTQWDGMVCMPLFHFLLLRWLWRLALCCFSVRCSSSCASSTVTGAADGYARMAGKPAFTLLHVGSGFANCHWDPAVAPPVPAPPLETPRVSPQTIQEVTALLTNGKKTGVLLGSHTLYGEGLELAGRIAATTGAALFAETFAPRLARGGGRVQVELIAYLPGQALPQLKKHEQLILVGALFPITTFAYKGKPVIKVPADCRVTTLATVDHVLLLFLYNTGARASEASRLTVGDLDLVSPAATLHGKGRKTRQCPLWKLTAAKLRELVEHRPSAHPVFLNRGGQALTRYGLHTLVERYARKAAVTTPTLRTKRVSPHTIRHATAMAMALLRSGVDINTIRIWLGHVSLQTTHLYAESDLKMKAKALARYEAPLLEKRKGASHGKGLMGFLRIL
jgi:integrase